MAPITDLYAKYRYPNTGINLPIVVMLHGFAQDAASVPAIDMERIANYGLFVVAPGMRGRDSADGSPDGSGREIYDIIDCVEYIKANYASVVDPNKIALVGYSGGGANALAAACKFPDYFTVIVDHFGMSDYGYDGTDGWWYTNAERQATLTTWIGDRASVVNPYHARLATIAVSNFTGGKLFMYHNTADSAVPVVNTNNIADAMDAAGLTNYSRNVSLPGDAIQWLHGYPNDNPGTLSTAEPTWSAEILSHAAWTIAASGTVTVIGYITTKQFTIWLNANGTAIKGIDAVAIVAYNTATDTYTVTPLTGAIDVAITQGAKTGSATNINTETVVTVT
jgi:predicted peptidase